MIQNLIIKPYHYSRFLVQNATYCSGLLSVMYIFILHETCSNRINR